MKDFEDRRLDALRARIRRTELGEQRLCINGRSHGPATHGVRCAWCFAVHRYGAVRAEQSGLQRPPGSQGRRRSA